MLYLESFACDPEEILIFVQIHAEKLGILNNLQTETTEEKKVRSGIGLGNIESRVIGTSSSVGS